MSTSNWIDDERSPPSTKRNGKRRRIDRRFGYIGAIDARIIRDVHLMVNAHRARIGLKAWDFKDGTVMAWCQQCWMTHRRQVKATGYYDSQDLCDTCIDQMREEAGDPPLTDTKWGSLFVQLAAMADGQEKSINPKPEKPEDYAKRLRSALYQSKITMNFSWGVKVDGLAVVVAKKGKLPDPWLTGEDDNDSDNDSDTEPESIPEQTSAPIEQTRSGLSTAAPVNNRWDDTLASLRSLKFGDTLTLTPDINDHIKYANQLRSMIHNRKLAKEADYGVSTYTDDGKQTGKVYVSKHEHGWMDQQSFKEEWRGKRANHMETSVAVEKTTTMHSEKVTATVTGGIGADINDNNDDNVAKDVIPVTASVLVSAAVATDGVQTECMTTLFLSSGGAIRLIFAGDMFAMSKRDREFVYGLVDRIERYREGKGVQLSPHTQKDDEKLYPVLMTLECLEDIYSNCMGADDEANAERVAMLAAWFRGDPAVKPPKVDK